MNDILYRFMHNVKRFKRKNKKYFKNFLNEYIYTKIE